MNRLIRRLVVVNRGEAAVRLVHAVRELNAAQPQIPPIQVIALHTSGEAEAMFVRQADIAYDLGPATARPYIDLDVLAKALIATKADAAWAG